MSLQFAKMSVKRPGRNPTTIILESVEMDENSGFLQIVFIISKEDSQRGLFSGRFCLEDSTSSTLAVIFLIVVAVVAMPGLPRVLKET